MSRFTDIPATDSVNDDLAARQGVEDAFAKAEAAGDVLLARCRMLAAMLAARRAPTKPRRQRKPRQPSLASVAKQVSKAALEVARYEIKPDGTVVVVTGKSESTEPNPWLDDLKVTKQ